MAEGWLRHLGGARVAVDSAGTDPKGVHPLAIRVMGEVGIFGGCADQIGNPIQRLQIGLSNLRNLHEVRLQPEL